MKWFRAIRDRFAGRSELDAAAMLTEFGRPPEDAAELAECLSVFDELYDVRPGWLRADDTLEPFTREPRVNPFVWLWVRAAYEDRLGTLFAHVNRAIERRGTAEGRKLPEPRTVGDYVDLYFGAIELRPRRT